LAPEHPNNLKPVKNARIFNIFFCCAGILAVVILSVLLLDTPYNLFVSALALIISIALVAVLFKNVREIKAVRDISDNPVYFIPLSNKQRNTIHGYLMRRGQTQFFITFMLSVIPEAALLTALYTLTDNSAYLLFMAVYSALCLGLVMISSLYLSVRLSVRNISITLSGYGIIIGQEVIPLDAKKSDALQLLRFSDYYYLKFIKRAVLGIMFLSEVIFPVGGKLCRGNRGIEDEEIVKAVGLSDIYVTEDPFYESRSYIDEEDSGTFSVGEKEPPKKQKRSRSQEVPEHADVTKMRDRARAAQQRIPGGRVPESAAHPGNRRYPDRMRGPEPPRPSVGTPSPAPPVPTYEQLSRKKKPEPMNQERNPAHIYPPTAGHTAAERQQQPPGPYPPRTIYREPSDNSGSGL